MKKIIFLISMVFIMAGFAKNNKDNNEKWTFFGRLVGYVQSVNVTGSNSQDAQKEGFTHNQELMIRFLGPIKNAKAGIEIKGRATNDNNIQKDGTSLLYFHSFIKNDIWYLEAGDVAASMNPYVFGGSLKGLKATYTSPKKHKTWNYVFIGGVKKATWKELMQSVPNEQPNGYSGAFEAKYINKRSQEIAFVASVYKDDLSTGDETNTTINGKKGIAFGIHSKWRFNRYFTLKGRFGLSNATDDIRNNKPMSSHTALQIKLMTKPSLRKLRSNFIYTRISPNYISLTGGTNKDMEQFENANSWRITNRLTSRFGFRFKRDNLNHDLNGTKRTAYEHISFKYRPKSIKRSNVYIKFSNMDINGRGEDSNTKTAGITFNLRQKSGWKYMVGLDYSNANDNNSTANITKSLRVGVGYKKRISKEKYYTLNITLNHNRIQQSNVRDKNYGVKVDVSYNHNSRLSFAMNYLSKFAHREMSQNSEYSSYQARVNYKLNNKGTKSVRLLLEKKHNDIENTPSASYDEYKARLSYVFNFSSR
ncbi:hypothetical protein [Nautilia lithotrophica]